MICKTYLRRITGIFYAELLAFLRRITGVLYILYLPIVIPVFILPFLWISLTAYPQNRSTITKFFIFENKS